MRPQYIRFKGSEVALNKALTKVANSMAKDMMENEERRERFFSVRRIVPRQTEDTTMDTNTNNAFNTKPK